MCPLPLDIPSISHLSRLLQSPGLSSLSHRANSHSLSNSHMEVVMFREGNGNPLQYSCLENPVDRGVWWIAVHRVAQSRTWLKRLSMQACMHWRRKWKPAQCSCLENSWDRGAWWGAVYGVAQSRTRLKRLSSCSSSGLSERIIFLIYLPGKLSLRNVLLAVFLALCLFCLSSM